MRCMSKNLVGAERSTQRGLSEHNGQQFHVLLQDHSLWFEAEDRQKGAQRLCKGSNRGKQESVLCRFLPRTERTHSPCSGVLTQCNLKGQKWQIQQTLGGSLILLQLSSGTTFFLYVQLCCGFIDK